MPKTAGEEATKDIRPRQGVALTQSVNQCDTLAGSQLLAMPDPRVFGTSPLDLWLWSGHPQGVPPIIDFPASHPAEHPGRGAFCVARVSRHEVPKTPGLLRYALSIRPR